MAEFILKKTATGVKFDFSIDGHIAFRLKFIQLWLVAKKAYKVLRKTHLLAKLRI